MQYKIELPFQGGQPRAAGGPDQEVGGCARALRLKVKNDPLNDFSDEIFVARPPIETKVSTPSSCGTKPTNGQTFMRIAILGERGLIGRALVASAPAGYQIAAFNRPEVDVRRQGTFADALTKFKPDVVINLAAELGSMVSGNSVKDMFETNTMGALTVAYAAKDAGAASYLFASSTVVHGVNKIGQHHGRFDGFAPRHPYGASKAAAELALQQFSKEGDGMTLVTVRPPQIIGEGSKVVHPPEEFVREASAGSDITLFGDGLHEREFVSVTDVAAGIWKAAKWSLTADRGYHPFFLTGNRISMKDLAQIVAKNFGTKVIFVPKTVQAFSLTTDPSDSWTILGWRASNDIKQILDDVARALA